MSNKTVYNIRDLIETYHNVAVQLIDDKHLETMNTLYDIIRNKFFTYSLENLDTSYDTITITSNDDEIDLNDVLHYNMGEPALSVFLSEEDIDLNSANTMTINLE